MGEAPLWLVAVAPLEQVERARGGVGDVAVHRTHRPVRTFQQARAPTAIAAIVLAWSFFTGLTGLVTTVPALVAVRFLFRERFSNPILVAVSEKNRLQFEFIRDAQEQERPK